jgi:hypothetical protein
MFQFSSAMAMRTRKHRQRQKNLSYDRELPEALGHPFYQDLNQLLDKAGFDEFRERRGGRDHEKVGHPWLAPGTYFGLMWIGYFEGIDSEPAWLLRKLLEAGNAESATGPSRASVFGSVYC